MQPTAYKVSRSVKIVDNIEQTFIIGRWLKDALVEVWCNSFQKHEIAKQFN